MHEAIPIGQWVSQFINFVLAHDNGTLVEGELDEETCTVECPRHGSRFDLHTGKPLTLPAYLPVETFPVTIEDEMIKVEVE